MKTEVHYLLYIKNKEKSKNEHLKRKGISE